MIRSPEKKQIFPIISTVLILVIFGAFFLLIAAPSDMETGGNKLCSSRIFDSFDHLDWLVEDESIRYSNYSYSAMGNVIFRELLFVEKQSADEYLSELSVQTIKSNFPIIIDNNREIKLLI